jgi:hypothetical protein
MTKDTKDDLVTWVQYFLIALLAELAAGMASLPYEQGNDINIYGYFQKRVQPHLYVWFIIFLTLSALRVAFRLILKRRIKNHSSSRSLNPNQ